jgi:Cu/Ag efflux protein CusF
MNPMARVFARFGLIVLLMTSCNKGPRPTVEWSSQSKVPAKRYHLKGKVVSIDQRAKMANIDSETIPDFMEAMTMPYQVKPESELDKLKPGDTIAADVVVQDEKAWLENIVVTAPGH